MWPGELVTERGIGNGMSLLIFAAHRSPHPGCRGKSILTPVAAGLRPAGPQCGNAAGIVTGVVYVEQGQRRIPRSTPRMVGMEDVTANVDPICR